MGIEAEVFMTGVFLVSVLTSLMTQAVKIVLDEYKKNYHPNMIAGWCSILISLLIGIGYVILNDVTFNAKIIVWFVALIILGWLCAMVGYDKVIQALKPFSKSAIEELEDTDEE